MAYSISEFESLYTGIFPPAMKLAMSLLHDESEARDAVQEVMLKLWESELVIANPQAFVLRSVRNTCINAINSKQVRERVMQKLTLDTVEVDEAEPEQRSRMVLKGVQQALTAREREVVDKVYTQNLSYKDAAAELGVSVAAVNKNVVSALRKLRMYIKNHNHD